MGSYDGQHCIAVTVDGKIVEAVEVEGEQALVHPVYS
jgi:hypothetical protein